MSALIAGRAVDPPPPSVNHIAGMPSEFGMMLNDNLGDCTCAAYYHARQVWTFNAGKKEVTEPDADVQQLYVQACGYNPKKSGPGPGGNEQKVLTYLTKKGAPIGPGGKKHEKIVAFVEVDHRNTDDVKRAISNCGIAYIGFPVPSNVSYDNRTWDYQPAAGMTNEGHAVILTGYDAHAATAISWGRTYTLTWAFVTNIVDEVYAIADQAWVTKTGKTPGGLTLAQLRAQMGNL